MESSRDLELRFVVDRTDAESLLYVAAQHLPPEMYDAERPVSYYRTVYLDTVDLRHLASYRAGEASRVRLRQYAAARDLGSAPCITSAVYLELKRSTGATREKLRVALEPEALARHADPSAAAAEPALAEVLAQLARGALTPQVMTWYRRLCLTDGPVRITFDEALSYCRPEPPRARGAAAEPDAILARSSSTVLEVKLKARAPGWLERALAGMSPSPNQSKYRIAMGALDRAAPLSRRGTLPLPVLT